MQYLIVVRQFESYRIGDVVTEEQAMEKILGSEHSAHVVRIMAPSEG